MPLTISICLNNSRSSPAIFTEVMGISTKGPQINVQKYNLCTYHTKLGCPDGRLLAIHSQIHFACPDTRGTSRNPPRRNETVPRSVQTHGRPRETDLLLEKQRYLYMEFYISQFHHKTVYFRVLKKWHYKCRYNRIF